jgi:hypothetical protein
VKGVHAQLTASYIGRCILGVVRENSEVTASNLIEQILMFAGYRVKYSKAWRAKQHAIALLWGDWKESYAKIPRVLRAMNHFNPGVKWFPYMTGSRVLDGCVLKPVLLRVFWCFPQCKVAFQHCRPVILVDGTFLTGKYRGTLMMAVAVDPEQQLVPLGYALAESENDDSWSWFMRLLRINVLGPTRQVCMISDRHHGLIKCASDHLDGYPPLVHRWCIRHFAANLWRRQKNKEVIGQLKLLASVHTEDKFKELHKDLVKNLNEEAKDWLEYEMEDKDKWAQAYDAGGMRWGIMTTNYSESYNNIFTGIRSRPVAGIIEYSFEKCNEYFVKRWRIARDLLDSGGRIGSFADEIMYKAGLRSVNQHAEAYGPDRMIYSIRGSSTTNVGGESHGGRHYRVDLRAGTCTCNGPQLLHLPCSHLMTACTARGLDYENAMYMSPLFYREHTIKIWESSFEPYLDPSQWPEYDGPEYVPLPSLKKLKKGRRQKKRLKGDMDACQGRFAAAYDMGDFEADADKMTYLCSKCHKEIKNCTCRKRKSKGKKKATGTNRRMGGSNSRVGVMVVR